MYIKPYKYAFAAPFEYISMPLAIMWGITVFGTFPGVFAWIGIVLIVGSGLYLIWSEANKAPPSPDPTRSFE